MASDRESNTIERRGAHYSPNRSTIHKCVPYHVAISTKTGMYLVRTHTCEHSWYGFLCFWFMRVGRLFLAPEGMGQHVCKERRSKVPAQRSQKMGALWRPETFISHGKGETLYLHSACVVPDTLHRARGAPNEGGKGSSHVAKRTRQIKGRKIGLISSSLSGNHALLHTDRVPFWPACQRALLYQWKMTRPILCLSSLLHMERSKGRSGPAIVRCLPHCANYMDEFLRANQVPWIVDW